MTRSKEPIIWVLGFIVGFLACQIYFDAKRIKKLEKLKDELIVLSNEAIAIAKENQAMAENWKLLYQLAE